MDAPYGIVPSDDLAEELGKEGDTAIKGRSLLAAI